MLNPCKCVCFFCHTDPHTYYMYTFYFFYAAVYIFMILCHYNLYFNMFIYENEMEKTHTLSLARHVCAKTY